MAEINTKNQYAEMYHLYKGTARQMQFVILREQGKLNPTVRKEMKG
jgi:hypothetical protein